MTEPAIITPHVPVNLTRHSLNSVVARDKALWKPPLKWTNAHLSALGIQRRRRRRRRRRCWPCDYQPSIISSAGINEEDDDSSDTDDERDRDHEGGGRGGRGGGGGEKGDENYHVVIPPLTPAQLGQCFRPLSGGGLYETRASRLTRLLARMPRQSPSIAAGHRDTNGDHERREDVALGRRFSFRWMTPRLVVGPRTYKLRFLFHLFLNDALVLPYVDSSCVLRPRFRVLRRRDLTRPFEPFIAAVLIGLAQSSVSSQKADAKKGQSNTNIAVNRISRHKTAESATDSLITTQLLFTHRDDSQDMHVYTAHISHALLDRFQYPNQPPTATTEPLMRLDHHRVPYEPQATFRHRLLAAVSVTGIVEPSPEEDDPRCRKRAASPHGEIVSPKRHRSSDYQREPLASLDVNFERYSQPP
ncbi:hypothetical protein F5Y07DRAFT_306080 [Xylaria sp. FL0933]|nr:hypothetical protein F5Y07DRAFT_306080 [Xylaria sp. FL0933]